MSGHYAQIHLRIWVDEEFLALSVGAQHLYMLLLSQEDRAESGLIPLRPRRWAKLSRGSTVEDVLKYLMELDGTSFLVVDIESAEVLIRSFIRNDKVYKHIRMLQAALSQAERVESPRIRSALGQELARLPALEVPESKPRNQSFVQEALDAQRHLDEVVSMLNDAPPDDPHGMAPWDEAKGWRHPPGTGTGTGTYLGVSSSSREKSLESNAHARLRSVPNDR